MTRPSLTQVYGSTPDEYMMYLLKDHIGEAEDMLPVLDLFRCAYASGVDNKRWWNDFFENFNPPPFSRRLLKQPRGNLI